MALDLKSLSEDVIQKMGYAPKDLWIVNLDAAVYGPFEVSSLKHYATENEALFEKATAARMDASTSWNPFYSYPAFQLIHEHLQVDHKDEKYWILRQGQKIGPIARVDVEKKMELGLINMNDLVSQDDGIKWMKFYQLDSFNHHSGNIEDLPLAPLESSFSKAKEALNERLANLELTGSRAGLAGLVFLSSLDKEKPSIKLDEIDLKSLNETEVSRSLKWAIPTAAASIALIVAVGSYVMSPSRGIEISESTPQEDNIPSKAKIARRQRDQAGESYPLRQPAAYQPRPMNGRSALTQASAPEFYPTQVETHHNEPEYTDPVQDIEPPQAEPSAEPSLVNNNIPSENESLDQSMNGQDVPAEQPVQESTDF